MIVVGLVLLIACANAANLLLAIGESRGAAKWQCAPRWARAPAGCCARRSPKACLIAGIAGTIGLSLSYWAAPLTAVAETCESAAGAERLTRFPHSGVHCARVDFYRRDLRTGARAAWTKGGSADQLERRLAAGRLGKNEVAKCLDGCASHGMHGVARGRGIVCRSLLNARSIDPGFDAHDAVAAALNVESFGYSANQGKIFYRDLLERLRSEPGVQSAGLAGHLPLGPITRMEPVSVEGQQADTKPGRARRRRWMLRSSRRDISTR